MNKSDEYNVSASCCRRKHKAKSATKITTPILKYP